MQTQNKDYPLDVQKLFIEMMLEKPEYFVRVQNIFKSENFDRHLIQAARFMQEHVDKYKTMPTFEQINAQCETDLRDTGGLMDDGHYQWFLDSFEGFTRFAELNRAIYKAVDLMDKGDFSLVEKLIKDAVQIGLVKNIGTDYFKDPRARLEAIRAGNGMVSTGWTLLDRALFGGMNRGELNIFAGPSNSGKSLFLQNLSVNWFTAGLHGIYITLEMSEAMCSSRFDAMVANTCTRDIFKNIDDIELKVKMAAKKSGTFQIKYMPAQSNINDIRSFLKEYHVQTRVDVDFVAVDYLDLLMPVTAKVSPNDLFVKDKYVSEEMRNLANELQVLMVTASQLNRSAVDEIEYDHSHISGGISKINTADNVFGIFTSKGMKERGKYQLQLMKTRSSSGVGKKIDLDFNIDTLRITDSDEDPNAIPTVGSTSNVLNSIRKNSVVKPSSSSASATTSDAASEEISKSNKGVAQSKQLKDMLSALRANKDAS